MSRRIRDARPEDVPEIAALVDYYMRRADLLPRTEAEIRDGLDRWQVAVNHGSIVGVGSLVSYNERLVELRSLAVAPAHQGMGVGAELVEALARWADQGGYTELFALTRRVEFFVRRGFQVVGMERFPEKVWRDCSQCPLREECDETPMVRVLRSTVDLRLPSDAEVGGQHAER